MKKLLSEFDPDGWKKIQQTMLKHGNAYFSMLSDKSQRLKTHKRTDLEKCRCQMIKKENSTENSTDMDELANMSATSFTASPDFAILLPSLLQELALPEPDSTIPSVQQQP